MASSIDGEPRFSLGEASSMVVSETEGGVARSWLVALEVLVAVVALATMSTALTKPVHGHFYFRQAHVMANVEKYLDEGPSLHPTTYNKDVPYSLFDFPAYEIAVSALVSAVPLDPLLVSRWLSLTCFLATLFLIDRLLRRTGASTLLTAATIFFFALSPLCLFYFVAPLVDVLAIALSLLSLLAAVRWLEPGSTGHWWPVMTLAGVLATLVKNPVYLPIVVAVFVFGTASRGPRFVLRRDAIAFAAAILAAVVLFKLYSNRVNGIGSFLSSSETADYFGPVEDRLDPRSWARILRVEREEMLNPLTWWLALAGLALFTLKSKGRYKSLYLGLVGGGVLALLVFFQRYTWHDYYQLPLSLPLAFCAAYAVTTLADTARALRPRVPGLAAGLVVLVAGVLGLSLYEGLSGYREVASTPTDWLESAGDWIRAKSAPEDFVVYVLDTEDRRDWNPAFLYFTKRDGYNLARKRVSPRILSSIEARFTDDYDRVLLFCPKVLWRELGPRLTAAGAVLLEAGEPGFLYRLPPPAPRTTPTS